MCVGLGFKSRPPYQAIPFASTSGLSLSVGREGARLWS